MLRNNWRYDIWYFSHIESDGQTDRPKTRMVKQNTDRQINRWTERRVDCWTRTCMNKWRVADYRWIYEQMSMTIRRINKRT
jgi:hypothetical protein